MGELHHFDVGCADCSLIKTSNGAVFLIDCHDIERNKHLLPASKSLRGVFVTHQHSDHFSGLDYLRHNGYSIDCLVYSPYERRYGDTSVAAEEWDEFNSHKDYFAGRGTKTYSVFRQDDVSKPWWDTNGIQFRIIGPPKSIATKDTRELHDASLVIHTTLTKRKCLFAGDASDESLQWISDNTNHYCDDILHASHHGSLNGACLDFVKGCNADYTVVSTESGVHENVPHPTAMQRYRTYSNKKVYRSDQDGSLKWTF